MQQKEIRSAPFERVFLRLAGTVLTIFTAAVLIGTFLFRSEIREQILHRDSVLLTHIAQYLHETGEASVLADWDLLELAYESSKIEGMIAVRVFKPLHQLIQQVPSSLYIVSLSEADQNKLEKATPVIRFFDDFVLDSLFSDVEDFESEPNVSLIEVIAPLAKADGTVEAAIQYWLDGSEVAHEFARMDRYLIGMAALFLLGGWTLFAIVFLYARQRLMGMAELLAERNRSLQKANAELAMAARTSAIGSVASHLFHGLKNPLAGLKAYLKVTTKDVEAIAIADRMQSLINESLSVIREDPGDPDSTLDIEELAELAYKKLNGGNGPNAGRLRVETVGKGCLETRKAQLLLLVLGNLVDNARAVSPSDKPVEVELDAQNPGLDIWVRDYGPGIPQSVRDKLFEPVISSKSEGTGIGLAISAILARHIPAELSLHRSDARGTEFLIHLQ